MALSADLKLSSRAIADICYQETLRGLAELLLPYWPLSERKHVRERKLVRSGAHSLAFPQLAAAHPGVAQGKYELHLGATISEDVVVFNSPKGRIISRRYRLAPHDLEACHGGLTHLQPAKSLPIW